MICNILPSIIGDTTLRGIMSKRIELTETSADCCISVGSAESISESGDSSPLKKSDVTPKPIKMDNTMISSSRRIESEITESNKSWIIFILVSPSFFGI